MKYCRAIAALPATTGAAMDVPCLRMVLHWSTTPSALPSAKALVTSPGATMSGLMRRSEVGPKDE